MLNSPYLLENFADQLLGLNTKELVSESKLIEEIVDYIQKDLLVKLNKPECSWRDFTAFWPPRYVEALRSSNAIVFFGSGLSLSAGIPTWNQLLSDNFNLDKSLIEDEELKADPLTLAELAGQYLGNEKLQEMLRNIMNEPTKFSINHAALAALRCPVYVTTNYDCMFEKAWGKTNGMDTIVVVRNDANMSTREYAEAQAKGHSFLYKIHGSSDQLDEQMILTRRDYRYHYRVNDNLFTEIRKLLTTKHTLFVGFSHRDPEVSRLVEDVIYEFERSTDNTEFSSPRPQFYSLQFDMRAHTPEVFAARGIVALTPPILPTSFDNIKTKSLAIALVDLIGAKERNLHSKVSLDGDLHKAINEISTPIETALELIARYDSVARDVLIEGAPCTWLSELCSELGTLASQGVYLLNDQGTVVEFEVPSGLNKTSRIPTRALNQRPYFQQAKSFRLPFVSDSYRSIYTGQSTFFLCVPILMNGQMAGLLFSASQVGQWRTPIDIAKRYWAEGTSFLLLDANGVCLVPPLNEFPLVDKQFEGRAEAQDANIGYSFENLLGLSRRDKLVRHISKGVVPVAQDDDVLNLSSDFRQFTIVSEVPKTRWKIGASIPVLMT